LTELPFLWHFGFTSFDSTIFARFFFGFGAKGGGNGGAEPADADEWHAQMHAMGFPTEKQWQQANMPRSFMRG